MKKAIQFFIKKYGINTWIACKHNEGLQRPDLSINNLYKVAKRWSEAGKEPEYIANEMHFFNIRMVKPFAQYQ